MQFGNSKLGMPKSQSELEKLRIESISPELSQQISWLINEFPSSTYFELNAAFDVQQIGYLPYSKPVK